MKLEWMAYHPMSDLPWDEQEYGDNTATAEVWIYTHVDDDVMLAGCTEVWTTARVRVEFSPTA